MYFMNSIFGISKLVSTCVAVLYNYTKASESLDFSICFFPQNSVFHCCESPNIHTRSGLIFQVSLSKMQKCLWRCHQQPGPWELRAGTAAPLPLPTRVLPVLLSILQQNLSGILQAPVSLRLCLFL